MSEIDWIQKKRDAQNGNTRNENRVRELKRLKFQIKGRPSAFSDENIERALPNDDCFIARRFFEEDVPIEDIVWYLGLRHDTVHRSKPTKADVLYHVESLCDCRDLRYEESGGLKKLVTDGGERNDDDDEKSDLEKLLDGEKDEIEDVYVEDGS